MRIFLMALVLAALAVPLAAQNAEAWLMPFAAAFQPDIGGFNSAFAAAHLPQARTRHFGWGIELRSLVSSVLIGPIFFRTWDDVSNTDYELRTETSGILGIAGLHLAPLQFLSVVPQLGLGGISQSFSIRERSGDVPLPELLQDPGRSAVLSPGMKFGGLAALELDLAATLASGRYGLSLRGGYLYSPFTLDWRLPGGASVTGVPDTKLAGPFFSAGVVFMPAPEVETGPAPIGTP